MIRTFQLPPPGVPHVWNDASEPQQRKVELWARNLWEFCRKWRLPRHFWVLLHAVNLRHGTDGFTSPPKEGVLRIFFARLRPGLNPRTWVPKTSTLTSRPPRQLASLYCTNISQCTVQKRFKKWIFIVVIVGFLILNGYLSKTEGIFVKMLTVYVVMSVTHILLSSSTALFKHFFSRTCYCGWDQHVLNNVNNIR